MEFYWKRDACILGICVVSIPNGMEFYDSFSSFSSASACFNSQRDGILLSLAKPYLSQIKWFQFPTGWNSTCRIYLWISYHIRFNSQRDGILLFLQLVASARFTVSIPNGMEFYRGKSAYLEIMAIVSIPNGMEFYKKTNFFISLSF